MMRIKRALKGKIRIHNVEEAQLGDRVFYKREKEEKWRGPGKVIGIDCKTVVIKHGSLLRNVNRIHITRIRKCREDELEEISSTGESEEVREDEEEELVDDDYEEEEKRKMEFRKGVKLSIKEKGNNFWKNIEILSRAGKAGGKWKNAFNVRDLDTKDEIWVNLDDYDVRNESEEEKSEKIDIIEGEEIYFC